MSEVWPFFTRVYTCIYLYKFVKYSEPKPMHFNIHLHLKHSYYLLVAIETEPRIRASPLPSLIRSDITTHIPDSMPTSRRLPFCY